MSRIGGDTYLIQKLKNNATDMASIAKCKRGVQLCHCTPFGSLSHNTCSVAAVFFSIKMSYT